ncbi:MAG: HAD family phosphatase [Lachnospiraceae bacterium]|nr:HAD family phosphatase [Lachnospiraceae bacterium]
MDIRIIATDMDGTLLDDEKRVPQKNLEALRACAKRGIEIVPATGRTFLGIPDELKELPGVRYAITINGASVVDLKENRILGTCRMPAETAAEVMLMARQSPHDIMYDVYVDGVGYTMDCFYQNMEKYVPSPGLAELIRKTRRVVLDHIAYIRESGREVEKINLYFLDMAVREEMRQKLMRLPGLLVSSSIPNNLEVNAAGADKGSALLRLAEFLGVERKQTMAFGDGENDLTMIKLAGIGIAMANGEEHVKAAADFVTCTNNEAGVAAAVRQFILQAK